MSHVNVHKQYQTMTRLEVAEELRRLAKQLEWDRCVPHRGGTIAVPYQIERKLKLDESAEGGAFTLEFTLKWVMQEGNSAAAEHEPNRST
jgi:hypothetical protein